MFTVNLYHHHHHHHRNTMYSTCTSFITCSLIRNRSSSISTISSSSFEGSYIFSSWNDKRNTFNTSILHFFFYISSDLFKNLFGEQCLQLLLIKKAIPIGICSLKYDASFSLCNIWSIYYFSTLIMETTKDYHECWKRSLDQNPQDPGHQLPPRLPSIDFDCPVI